MDMNNKRFAADRRYRHTRWICHPVVCVNNIKFFQPRQVHRRSRVTMNLAKHIAAVVAGYFPTLFSAASVGMAEFFLPDYRLIFGLIILRVK